MAQGEEAPVIAADQPSLVRGARWLALAACGWAVIFAALSFFWAAGGQTGLHPLEQSGDSGGLWIAANLLAGLLKLCLGIGALAMVGAWRPRALRRPLRVVIWLAGVGMLLYGGAGLISDILHVAGVVSNADGATRHWFLIYLILWDPWWMLGGALYLALAWRTHPTRR